ncbi:hypothetical protein [Pendulispora albinea]|uniref:Tetratricopeptide repeat protein n=1 Tax=Pendulispora albinea TaxID=2741071 RepID=A0ABZ2M1B7_9BACT
MRRALMVLLCIGPILVAAWLGLGRGTAPAQAYVPRDDAEVLAPSPAWGPREARAQLARDPTNVALATELAKRDIEEARVTSDPRYLGHAQAALAPWWNDVAPPPEVLLLRATIRQSQHAFDEALLDLNELLRRTPGDAQAWLTRSVVLSVRGEYAASRASCAPLRALAGDLVSAQCLAAVDSLSGRAREAYAYLGSALRAAEERATLAKTPLRPAERAWILATLGEIAVRAGDDAAAEAHHRAALDADPSDAYTRAAYADLLLDQDRPAEVLSWLHGPGRENDDNLLLRLAIAEAASNHPAAESHRELLRARYLASQERGDVVHRREQARFHLVLLHDPSTALELAKANWQVQREPADARVFLESALAARSPAEAMPVLTFLEANRAEEPRLVALRSRVRELLPARPTP